MKDFIGVFDSGMGGITVLGDLLKMLPTENYSYFGDSANAPYGPRPREEVVELTLSACRKLVDDGAKALVIACNTATSAAIDVLRSSFDLPVVGMEPALKPAVLENEGGVVAVLATEMTLKEEKFSNLMLDYKQKASIYKVPAPRLVEFVEQGVTDSPELRSYLEEILGGIEKVDAIVLGCTHFLYLKDVILSLYPDVKLYDGNEGTVNRLISLLDEKNLLSNRKLVSFRIENSKSEEMVERSQNLLRLYMEKQGE